MVPPRAAGPADDAGRCCCRRSRSSRWTSTSTRWRKARSCRRRRYNDVVAKLHQYTGLSERYIRDSNLRIPYWRFATELLRNSGVMIGRYDARYTSYKLDRLHDRPDFDPTDAAIDAAFVATGNYYMRDVLGYHTTLIYCRDQRLPAVGLEAQRQPSDQHRARFGGGDGLQPEPADIFGQRLLRFCDAVLRDGLHAQPLDSCRRSCRATSAMDSTSRATWSICTRPRSRNSTTTSSAGTRRRFRPAGS